MARGERLAACAAALLLLAGLAEARSRRLALVVGANTGRQDDVPLRYAELDAERFAGVLREVGDFDGVRVLAGADAAAVAGALDEARARIRDWRAAGDSVLFLFFYSGHGDPSGLRLGGTLLPYEDLLARLAAAGADLRIAILDACHSGAGTRGKGLTARPRVSVELEDELATAGQAILASSSASEAAQESDALKGSFFTSNLVTGLRGAADRDGDARVDLGEAYAYARARTVQESVVSAGGLQHPTYQVRLAGGDVVPLTWPGRSETFLSFLSRSGGPFLVLSDTETMVLAEVASHPGETSRVGLAAGRYVVKKRGERDLLVARVFLARGADAVLDENEMQRVPYARLARKGARPPGWISILAGAITPLAGASARGGLELGYVVDLDGVALWPALGLDVGAGSDGLGVVLASVRPALGVVRLWRRPRWSLLAGVQASVPFYLQRVEASGTRARVGLGLDALAGATIWVSDRVGVVGRVRGGGRWLEVQDGPIDEPGHVIRGEAAFELGLELRF